jgi:anti-sigma-K factor RskA
MTLEVENHIRELIPGFVLDILSVEETAEVAEHLASCDSCLEEYTRLKDISEDLPLALAQTAPPPALKNKVMHEIHARQEASTPKPGVVRAQTSKTTFLQQLAVFLRRSAPVWAIGIIAILALVNLSLWNQLSKPVTVQPTLAMRVVALANTDASPQATGSVVMDQSGRYGTLVVSKLASLDPSQKYQVWLIQNGQRTSGGLFSVNEDGYASLELWAPQPLNQYEAIGITVEPAGGSPGPTGVKVMGGNLSQ